MDNVTSELFQLFLNYLYRWLATTSRRPALSLRNVTGIIALDLAIYLEDIIVYLLGLFYMVSDRNQIVKSKYISEDGNIATLNTLLSNFLLGKLK